MLAVAALPLASAAEPVDGTGPVRLDGWVGYQFTSSITTAGGTVSVDGAPSYGAAVSLAVDPEFEFELLWTLSPTEAHFVSSAGAASSGLPNHLNVSYFQAGFTKSIRCGDFECFGDFTLGAVLLSPGAILLPDGQRLNVHDTWRAAFTFGAGVRFFFAERLAFLLQARLLVPVYITGGGFYAGNGGAALVIGAGIPCVEGAFSAGLIFVL